MVVMLLISIILAVAIPRFDGGMFQDPQKKLSRWLIHTVKSLRSTAIQKRTLQTLVIDFENNKMWTIAEQGDGDASQAQPQRTYELPEDIRIVEMSFPNDENVNSGTANVNFYPAGYSDSVVIRLERSQAERISFRIEPLMPKVRFYDEWISF
jgi:Tfp pilus assembly protein FimT